MCLFHFLLSCKHGLSTETCMKASLSIQGWLQIYCHKSGQKSHWISLHAQNVVVNAYMCMLYYVLMLWRWVLQRDYPHKGGCEESTHGGTSRNSRYALNRVSIIHSFIYLGHLRLLYKTECLLWWCIYFQCLGLPVAIKLVQVPDSSWLHCLHYRKIVRNNNTNKALKH